MGAVLLTVGRERNAAQEERPVSGRGITVAALAQELGVPEAWARTCATRLASTGCLREVYASVLRRESLRRVRAYHLPPANEERGPGRKPRWHPVALIVEPDATATNHVAHQLRTYGCLPLAVATSVDALALLDHLAFEMVVLPTATASTGLSDAEIISIRQAAREAACGSVLVVNSYALARQPYDGSLHP